MTRGPDRDFEAEASAFRAILKEQREVAVPGLRALHEAWARSLLGLGGQDELVPAVRAAVEAGLDRGRVGRAIAQLEAAEERQWEIGTWSTGSGEGLASMSAVRALQIARAWLRAAEGDFEEARALANEAMNDPNRIAARHSEHVDALFAWIDETRG